MSNDRSPHEVLGLAKDANTLQVISAYRRLAMKWHPDRNRQTSQAKERFQEINQAYMTLIKENSPTRWRQQWNNAGSEIKQKTHTEMEELPYMALCLLGGGVIATVLMPTPDNWLAFSVFLFLANTFYQAGRTAFMIKMEGYFKFAVRLYFVTMLGVVVLYIAQRL